MGNKFEIWAWTRYERTSLEIQNDMPEYKYIQMWVGDDYDDAISNLALFRGSGYGCIKLEIRE